MFFINDRKAVREAGFTLLELLVVITILVLLAVGVVPALKGTLASINLAGASDAVQAQLSLARQTAISRNLPVELRIYQFDDGTGSAYRTVALLIPSLASGKTKDEWLTAGINLPGISLIDGTSGQDFSTVLTKTTAAPSIMEPNVPGPWAGKELPNSPRNLKDKDYVGFRFQPDGTTNLPKDQPWCLSFKSPRALPPPSGVTAPAADYITLVIDPLTGHTLTFRP